MYLVSYHHTKQQKTQSGQVWTGAYRFQLSSSSSGLFCSVLDFHINNDLRPPPTSEDKSLSGFHFLVTKRFFSLEAERSIFSQPDAHEQKMKPRLAFRIETRVARWFV
jgi:hypothetical protein